MSSPTPDETLAEPMDTSQMQDVDVDVDADIDDATDGSDTKSPSTAEDSSAAKDTPSKQSLKEQLEQDWAEDDSQDTADIPETKETSDMHVHLPIEPTPSSAESLAIDSTSILDANVISSLEPSVETLNVPPVVPFSEPIVESSFQPTVESTLTSVLESAFDAPVDSTETDNVDNTSIEPGLDTSFNTPLDGALDSSMTPIDSNTEAAFENIIDSALASAAGAPSMPTLTDSDPVIPPVSAEERNQANIEANPESIPESKDSENNDQETSKEENIADKTEESKDDDEEDEEEEEEEDDDDGDDGEDGEGDDGEADAEDGEEEEEKKGRKMRMHLTTQMMQKLIKEGNMERQPNGTYKIKAEALKELQNNLPKDEDDDEMDDEEEEEEDEEEEDEDDADMDDEEEEDEGFQPDQIDKKIHPESKAEETVPERVRDDETTTLDANGGGRAGDQNEALADGGLGGDDIPGEEIRKRSRSPAPAQPRTKKAKYTQDYVSDYNSSEEEEESSFGFLRENIKSMMPRRGKSQTKGISFLEEVHKHLFPHEEDSESELSDLSDSDMDPSKTDFSPSPPGHQSIKKLCPGTSNIEAKLGMDGGTILKIVATGQIKEVQGKLFDVYNIVTTTEGSATSTTPLMIPRTTSKTSPVKKKPDGSVLLYHQPHVKVDPEDPNLIEELEDKRVKLRNYKQQIKLLRLRYLQLVQERMSKPGFNTLADLVNAASKFMSDEQLLFTTMQLKSGCLNTQGMRWSPREKILALGIYQQEPAQYDNLRRLFHLPNKKVLDRWLECIAKSNAVHAKKLMYHIYTRFAYKEFS